MRSSHENYDGTGYPDALERQEIPLGSRIIAVCDAFDAMTTDRPYRRAMNEASAISQLRRCAGSQFDPTVVQRFCEALQIQDAKMAARRLARLHAKQEEPRSDGLEPSRSCHNATST